MIICRVCREEFSPGKKHPGYINVCLEEDCQAMAKGSKTVPQHEQKVKVLGR